MSSAESQGLWRDSPPPLGFALALHPPRSRLVVLLVFVFVAQPPLLPVAVATAALRVLAFCSVAAAAFLAPAAASMSVPLTVAIALPFAVRTRPCWRREFCLFVSTPLALVAAGFGRGLMERGPALHFFEHAFAVASFSLERNRVCGRRCRRLRNAAAAGRFAVAVARRPLWHICHGLGTCWRRHHARRTARRV
ncbi:hypothetical protein BKA80DRAFT_263047 [Phyllosticta citrichinensis]